MFTYAVRNIVHKQSAADINILYYPSDDLIDDIITDLPNTFFILTESFNNRKIHKNNTRYLNNISLFEYDFIFSYELNNSLLDMSSKLHIPLITYLKYGTYDNEKIPEYKNVYYIVEHKKESEQDKLLTIVPQVYIDIKNEENNICLFINNNNHYGNIVQLLSSEIKNLSIVDEEKIDQKAMIEILSKHKVCLDLYPKSIYKMLCCAKGGLPYITIPNSTTEEYKKIYDGVHFMQPDLRALVNILNTLSSGTAVYKTNLPKINNQNHIQIFLDKIKKKGMIL